MTAREISGKAFLLATSFVAAIVFAPSAQAQSNAWTDFWLGRKPTAQQAQPSQQLKTASPAVTRSILRAPRADAAEADWDEPFDAAGAGARLLEGASGNSAVPIVNTVPVLSRQTLSAMGGAIVGYSHVVAAGGWGQIPPGKTLKLGVRDARVAALRARLFASGDLNQVRGDANAFDSYVLHAVSRYQRRNGLRPTGFVGERTLSALNVPARARLAQLEMNVARIKKMVPGLARRFVMVNIPGAEIEAVSRGVVELRHRAVVGKVDRPTPLVTSKITQLNFNPYWHVPESIVQRDLVPQLRNDLNYLERTNLRVYSDWYKTEIDASTVDWNADYANNLKFRQEPGEGNALGHVRINFSNSHQVYLHDTPKKALFGQELRADSSGCVRVQNVDELVMWLLRDNSRWSRDRLNQVVSSGEGVDENLNRSVPLYMIYITAWATDDGTVHFRRDLYERDGVGQLAANY